VCVECASELIVKPPDPVRRDYLRFIFNASEINMRVKERGTTKKKKKSAT